MQYGTKPYGESGPTCVHLHVVGCTYYANSRKVEAAAYTESILGVATMVISTHGRDSKARHGTA
jgi:hypothetical protein